MDKKIRDLSKGWALETGQVRTVASRMGIPESVPLPLVSVDEDWKSPGLQEYPSDPTGYLIKVPLSSIASHTELGYTLGQQARGDIRHELAHYLEHLEEGTRPGKSKTPKRLAERELDAEIRGRTGLAGFKYLAYLMAGLVQEYGITPRGSVRLVRKAALDRGYSRRVISRAENLFRSYAETE